MTGGHVDSHPYVSAGDAHDLFRRIRDLHAARDPALIGTVFTDGVVVEDDGATAIARGHAELAAFLASVWRAFPDFRVEIVAGPYLAEDGFAVHGRVSGTMRGPLDPPGLAPTGAAMATEFGGFYEVEDQRIRRVRVILDARDIAVQLSALPAPGSAGERAGVWLQRLLAWRARRRRRAASERHQEGMR